MLAFTITPQKVNDGECCQVNYNIQLSTNVMPLLCKLVTMKVK